MMTDVLQRFALLRRARPGSLLLEVLVGMAVFAVFLSSLALVLLRGQEGTIHGGDQVRGVAFVDRALDATRSIRDGGFSSLTGGAHGVALGAGSKWVFSGTQSSNTGGYVTVVTITSIGAGAVRADVQTKWKHGYNRSGSILVSTEFRDWRTGFSIGAWSSPTLEGSYVDAGNPQFNDVAVSGNYAFVTSQTNDLYIFNITTLTSPSLGATFSLGAASYDVLVNGKTLYMMTADANAEVKAYDITSPTSPSLLASYNIAGSARGLSLATDGKTLFVGVSENGTGGNDEFYALDITNSGALTLQSSLNDTSTFTEIALSGTSAYLAGSADELRVGKVADPSAISFLGSVNLSGTEDGLSMALAGTSTVLGRAKGGSTSEFTLFNIKSGGVPDSPGPWYQEASGSLVAVDVDPTQCYAFTALQSGHHALEIIKIKNLSSLPLAASYDSASGLGRGLQYDPVRDRLYLLTDKGFLIMKPGNPPANCPI